MTLFLPEGPGTSRGYAGVINGDLAAEVLVYLLAPVLPRVCLDVGIFAFRSLRPSANVDSLYVRGKNVI